MFDSESEGLGYIAWWGLTPGINLLKTKNKIEYENANINILSVGANDTRHIMSTITSMMDTNYNFSFTMIENNIESVAREILQLYLLGKDDIGFQDKTEIFLELFGNTLIRDLTETWLDVHALELMKLATNGSILDEFHPVMDLKRLKSKDRDHLECVFKSWRRRNLPKFDVSTYWDSRVRQHLGSRYDAIPNVFDWDCSITLSDRGIKTFESSEYGRWRKSGIAFAPRQASYLAPNRTLASPRYFSNRVASGDLGGSVLIGYWGDIVCSPYLAFGTTTERSKELSRTLPGGKQVYGASVISEVNLRCLLWEIQNGMPAPSSIASVNYGLYTPQSNNYDDSEDNDIVANDAKHNTQDYKPQNLCKRLEVTFLTPGTSFTDLSTRMRSLFTGDANKISAIYVGNCSLRLLNKTNSGILDVCTENCRLIIESVLYIPGLRSEAIEGFVKRAAEIAENIGFEWEKLASPLKDHHLFFVRKSISKQYTPSAEVSYNSELRY